LIRRRRAYGGRVVDSEIGPKLTEIGMIFRLQSVRTGTRALGQEKKFLQEQTEETEGIRV
jgi:hypothetical protein